MFWVLLLLLAWAVAGTACTRLCLAAVHAAAMDTKEAAAGRGHDLSLYEAAFLSGGPRRVADLTLVSMARQRRLLLAHTGWATVVDPRGRDEMERSVIGAIGPEGQSRIEPVRDAAAAADAVGSLANRLVSAGLAVPDGMRSGVAAAIRRVRLAAAVVLALGAIALLTPAQSDMPAHLVALWFALPFVLTLSCLAIARIEIHPYTQWASPAGQRLLSALVRRSGGGDDRRYLTSVAVRGVRAIGEPELRAAFARREPPPEVTPWRG
ncbi:TIGR04222 domain-containing membrane protein [Streptomyces sp. ISL-22]|uniref:TIGR04222 domain-containing membrane protein n=1 Tax=unclassified Streptomyces TaxID=2593676 RepID=UPI001BECCEBF|nr:MULTISPECIES: TIGR04222 domain-containing membrane protein [unclassified Streptomyces]MBT2421182.1 TIGR04222 domain-containing membrane protein [Streptomyces sp. ISL-24]MBT2432825.1 TIGR04222 domain-containing membrane protein [Streptomyces sp. ISL-22]